MRPVKIKEANIGFTNYDGHFTHAFRSNDAKGVIVCCYKLSFIERLRALFVGNIWFTQTTGNANPRLFLLTTRKSKVIAKVKVNKTAKAAEKDKGKPSTPPNENKSLNGKNVVR